MRGVCGAVNDSSPDKRCSAAGPLSSSCLVGALRMWAEAAEEECTGPLKGTQWECDSLTLSLTPSIVTHTHTHAVYLSFPGAPSLQPFHSRTRKLTEEQGILLAARVCAMSIIYSVGGDPLVPPLYNSQPSLQQPWEAHNPSQTLHRNPTESWSGGDGRHVVLG